MNAFLPSLLTLLTLTAALAAAPPADLASRIRKLGPRPTGAQLGAVLAAKPPETPADQREARGTLAELLQRQLDATPLGQLSADRRRSLTTLADALWLLLLNQREDCRATLQDTAFRRWLLASPQRTADLLANLAIRFDQQLTLLDNYPRVLDLLRQLYRHAGPQEAERHWPLMLALALVWDTPDRTPLHHQMGPQPPDATPDLPRRFDFFRRTLDSRDAPFRPGQLSIAELTFVVDTPLPVDELEWVRENVRLQSPERLFHAIRYDQERLARAAWQWPYGPYTLPAIRQLGGICTDQAYFTVITLRALGYPAILFAGEGRRGGHAWVACLQPRKGWVTDIGRFKDDRYTTGEAVHPQTGVRFNDHLLPLVCDRSPKARQADALARLAAILTLAELPRHARLLVEQAITLHPTSTLAWDVRAHLADDATELTKLLERQANAFRDFPDLVQEFRLRQARILRLRGHTAAADRILQQQTRRAGKRDDLAADAALAHVNAALQDGQPQKARKLFEAFLKNYRQEAAKLLAYLDLYLDMTRQTGQADEALRFLKSFVRSLKRTFDRAAQGDPRFRDWDTRLLIQAHENNGDHQQAEKLRRKLD
ncbi:MAG: hypothetical protein ACI4WT_14500 [Oligosphaeraceae bacterium]